MTLNDWLTVLLFAALVCGLFLLSLSMGHAEDWIRPFDSATMDAYGVITQDEKGQIGFEVLIQDVSRPSQDPPTLFFEPQDDPLRPLCAIGPTGQIDCYPTDPLTQPRRRP